MDLAQVFKDLEKISGKGSIMQGVEVKDIERIALPMAGVNRMLYGGIPKGRLIEFSGADSSGKTTTAILVARAYQQQDARPIFFVDVEGTYDAKWGAHLGLDQSPERFIKWAPENATAEEILQGVLDVAMTNEVGLIILDSLPAMVPQQEDTKTLEQYQMGGISKPLTVFTRKLQKILLSNDSITFIGIMQLRDNMSAYGPPTATVGGRAWKHLCSLRLEFKSENVDANYNYVSDGADNPAGVKILVALKKNKTAPRNRKLSYYVISFEKGFEEVLDLVEVALILDIVKRRGAYFSYNNNEGEVLLNSQGKAKFIEDLESHPQILEQIRKEVMEYGD